MGRIDRREFLRVAGALGAAGVVLPSWVRSARAASSAAAAAELTTLSRTIAKGSLVRAGSAGAYHRLAEGPGEPHVVRDDLGALPPDGGRDSRRRRSLLSFVHLTDVHIVDAQSPARVEFLDRYADPGGGCESIPFSSAFRPQEALTTHILEAMVRQIRAVRVSPVTGAPFAFAVCTGDNIDNQQLNELRWFIDILDGRPTVAANSGGPAYEGVQSAAWADPEYWHPDESVADKYKQQWGFPDYPGLLEAAVRPFAAAGIGLPWLQTYGNHDGLLQGNAPQNPVFEAAAVGPLKLSGLPPGVNPCDAFETLRDNPQAFLAAPARPVTEDRDRRIITRAEYIAEMFATTGRPAGHGFTRSNLTSGVAYWYRDHHPAFRIIALDTVNPGGFSEGSIGARQFAWLQDRLVEVSSRYLDASGNEVTTGNRDRYVILVSHHGPRSLDNPFVAPDPFDPAANDVPRVLGPEVMAMIHRFPNVVAWVNGHTHNNIVEPRANGRGGGFWDIGTAAHIDWSCQSRLIDVVDNHDGTLSILCTMVDHAGPLQPGGGDDVLTLASVARELAANDYQYGFASKGRGGLEDRNVELLISAPFRAPVAATVHESSATRRAAEQERAVPAPAPAPLGHPPAAP